MPECLWNVKNKQILRFCLKKKLKKIKKNVTTDDFWPDLPVTMTLSWQQQISWTHGLHIKISARDE